MITLSLSGTATYGTDYAMTTQMITIPAGYLNGNSMLSSIDDPLVETGETIVVEISDVVNVSESRVQQVAVTIVDDDKPVIPPTATPIPMATPTAIPEATFTPIPSPISTPTNTNTPAVTPTISLIATPTVTSTVAHQKFGEATPTKKNPVKPAPTAVNKTLNEVTLPKFVYLPFISR